jgi:hypothetical protein
LNEHAHSVGGVAHAQLRTPPRKAQVLFLDSLLKRLACLWAGFARILQESAKVRLQIFMKRLWREMSAEFFFSFKVHSLRTQVSFLSLTFFLFTK